MKEQFIEKRFNQSSIMRINAANQIIAEYMADGYTLTLRQLYYQFVGRGLIENNIKQYKILQSVINDARLAGLIDWDAIEDRTRNLFSIPNYSDPPSFLTQAAAGYAEDLWANQPYYCEVWVEKEALAGVVDRSCNRLRVPFFSCRGYTSQSEAYFAGKRLAEQIAKGKQVVIFHLGDHDPSGLDMTRDNQERLSMFANGSVDLRRLALNSDQIEEYDPPPNPAKLTDTRAEKYVEQWGDSSWELDALDPQTINQILSDNIEKLIVKEQMRKDAEAERENKRDLFVVAKFYESALNTAKLRNVGEKIRNLDSQLPDESKAE